MSQSAPMPEMPNSIDVLVTAFAELLYAPRLAVVCRERLGGFVVAVNTYTDITPAMMAVWACDDEVTVAEAHPTGPLTEEEAT